MYAISQKQVHLQLLLKCSQWICLKWRSNSTSMLKHSDVRYKYTLNSKNRNPTQIKIINTLLDMILMISSSSVNWRKFICINQMSIYLSQINLLQGAKDQVCPLKLMLILTTYTTHNHYLLPLLIIMQK